MNCGYDIIGDIHGHAPKLEALLRKLGFHETRGAWRHPTRKVIFVGDFIDRGPHQVQSVYMVRGMVEAGSALAVMGNHELNAIAWHTPHPGEPGEFLRRHHCPIWGAANRQQHAAFLAEVQEHPSLHSEIVEWFLTLPLWLDLPGLRVVHACWHQPFIDWLSPRLHLGRYLTRELIAAATDEPLNDDEKDNDIPSVLKAVKTLTKGVEIPLPDGHAFRDKDGISRPRVRLGWWRGGSTYRTAAIMPDIECASVPDLPLPEYALLGPIAEPTFFGHYWLTGEPHLQSPKAACVDYSAGNGGPLVAYRYDGESELSAKKFVAAS